MLGALLDSQFDRFAFSARHSGCVASRVLRNGAAGRVLAVFEATFYVELGVALAGGLACVGGAGLAAAPLNLITTAPEATNWRASGVRLNAAATVSANTLLVGERFAFDLTGAAVWTPDPAPVAWDRVDLERGLRAVREASARHVPDDGLGRFIRRSAGPFEIHSICERAEAPVDLLTGWVRAALHEPSRANAIDAECTGSLLGLGPGLTPSGDDFVGGMMIALRGLGEAALCQRLWTASRPRALEAGNPIAFAHLAAASEGLGNIGPSPGPGGDPGRSGGPRSRSNGGHRADWADIGLGCHGRRGQSPASLARSATRSTPSTRISHKDMVLEQIRFEWNRPWRYDAPVKLLYFNDGERIHAISRGYEVSTLNHDPLWWRRDAQEGRSPSCASIVRAWSSTVLSSRSSVRRSAAPRPATSVRSRSSANGTIAW